jgi:hypothetical protein
VERDLGEGGHGFGDLLGEEPAVHGQGAARGHAHLVGHADDQRAHPPHLLLEEPGRLVERVAAQAVRAHELGQVARLVHGRLAHGPHLEEIDGHAAARELPGRLAPGQPTADDGDALRHVRLA